MEAVIAAHGELIRELEASGKYLGSNARVGGGGDQPCACARDAPW